LHYDIPDLGIQYARFKRLNGVSSKLMTGNSATQHQRLHLIVLWLALTLLGSAFALQLHWHYGIEWSISFFWGLTDWYLWGLLGLGMIAAVGSLSCHLASLLHRAFVYVVLAPIVAGVHVILTMLFDALVFEFADSGFITEFQTLYAKKLTLNLVAYAVAVAVGEKLAQRPEHRESRLLARLGEQTRVLSPQHIIWGDVAGNYVNLHTTRGVWPVRSTLQDLIRRLPPAQFMQISRSIVVNIDYLEKTTRNNHSLQLRLSDGSSVTVARRFQAQVRKTIYNRFSQ